MWRLIAPCLLREVENGNIFYDEALSSVEGIREISDSATRKPNAEQEPKSPYAPHSMAEFFAGINSASVSKIVDENGESVVYHGTKTSLTQRTQRFLMQRSQRIWMQRAQRAFASVARKTLRCSITTGWQNETEGRWRIDGAIMFIDNRVKVKNIYVMRHSKTGQYASSPLFTRVWRHFIGIQEEDVEKCGSVIYWLSTGWLREADHRTKQKNLPLPSPHL